jgi:5-methyltetrahydropteroyltriglutamate--homocysteine methyltransferase
LVAAGVRDLQIDEPAISVRADELDLASRALGAVTEGLDSRVRTWTHVCYGEFGPVMERILELPVKGLMLELSNSEFDMLEALGGLPDDKLLGAGVVDVHTHDVESADAIRSRIERVLDVLPPERVWINPDCGLKTRTAEQAKAKLQAMVEATRAAREARGL